MKAKNQQAIVNMLMQIAVHQLHHYARHSHHLPELRDFNKEQIAINERLEKLLQGLLPVTQRALIPINTDAAPA